MQFVVSNDEASAVFRVSASSDLAKPSSHSPRLDMPDQGWMPTLEALVDSRSNVPIHKVNEVAMEILTLVRVEREFCS